MSLQTNEVEEFCPDIESRVSHTGFKRDPSDDRDLERVYGAPAIASAAGLPVVDLRKYVHQVYDQGKLGSCSANVICAAYELELKKEAHPQSFDYYHFNFSRLFLYYNSRVYDGTTRVDKGATFRDALRSIHERGICRESLWPYKTGQFAVEPTPDSYHDARGKTITKYEAIRQNLQQMKACLSQEFPFAFGFHIYKSFCIKKDGFMPMPSPEEIENNTKPGSHGVLAVGYDDRTKCFTVLNSWGERFGDKGYFYMPYDYITNPKVAFDFWKIEKAREEIEIVVHNNVTDTNELVEIVIEN